MGHDHSHSHGTTRYDRAFLVGVALNLAFVVVEVVFGVPPFGDVLQSRGHDGAV